MLIEIFELLKIFEGFFYYLPIHLILFVLFPLVVRRFKAIRYSPCHSLSRRQVKVSVVIPEYNEDKGVFEKCLASVATNKPDEIIVVHDDSRDEVEFLARKYGAKVYSFKSRVGKRAALARGWEMASGDIIVHVDSDTILYPNAIEEIIKPFSDEQVVGVQGKCLVYRTGSWFSWRMSQLIEANRDWNNKALNGCLVVIDGRFNAWRREFLISQEKAFLNEYFLGRRCEIGDDRFLTQRANLQGYKTVYQSTAAAETAAQPTYLKFLKQQLRWARSGYKSFFKDFKLGLARKAPLAYNIFQICYYLGSISFTFAILHDILLSPPIFALPLWSAIPIATLGSGLIAVIRRLAVGFYSLTPKEFLMLGFTAIFISYPLMLYALATIRNQSNWQTRTARSGDRT
ncbi:MAG: glycosyltransferase [Candidatus Bathyarchaeia archaeon]